MNAKIAIATTKGKPYYFLVKKLNENKIPFESIMPGEEISSTVRIVITTPKEKSIINHSNILIFNEQSNLENMLNDNESSKWKESSGDRL